ncbi:MAG: methyltransferase domain-containing protein [Pseudomonadota bacterium]
MTDKYLNKVYGLATPAETKVFYDTWSDSYDSEVLENGYATPMRVARALAAHLDGMDQPLLDYGCGTGLSGAALVQIGFTDVDGADLSPEMLAEAVEKGVYCDTWQINLDAPLPFEPGAYAAITATGVIGAGAAPPETLEMLLNALAPKGLLVFSYNDHTLADEAYSTALRQAIDADLAEVLFEEHGPHLPKIDLDATVYVLERQ